jgi:hypothetical protein
VTLSEIPDGVIHTGGGRFRRQDGFILFVVDRLMASVDFHNLYKYILVSLTEVSLTPTGLASVRHVTQDLGQTLMLDSGVYGFVNDYIRKHDTDEPFGEVRKKSPSTFADFEALVRKYVQFVQYFENDLWGYVEIDIGSPAEKTATRKLLEGYGLKPIPVYHPAVDDYDYFDYLAERYDRVCCGNMGQASEPIRMRILATLYERARKYPYLWVHVLGTRNHHWFNAYPLQSADATSWLEGLRFGQITHYVDGYPMGALSEEYTYRQTEQYAKARHLAAYTVAMDVRVRRDRNEIY